MDPNRDFVATDKLAYLILPAEFVCGPTVEQMEWSLDGERLAVIRRYTDISPTQLKDLIFQKEEERTLPEPETQVVVWSTVSRKATTLFKMKQSQGTIDEMYWISGSSQLVVVGTFISPDDPTESHRSIVRIAANGSMSPIAQIDPAIRYEIQPCPYKSQVAYIQYPSAVASPGAPTDKTPTSVQPAPQAPGVVRFFGTTGGLSQPVTLPAKPGMLSWDTTGQAFVLTFLRDPKTKHLNRVWYSLNQATQKFEACAAPSNAYDPTKDDLGPDLMVQSLKAKVAVKKVGINAPTVILMATVEKQPEPEPGIVTTDGDQGQLSPTFNAVSYIAQGSLMVRPMVKIPLEAYKLARLAAIRRKLMEQAKQVALGMIMYSNDYDDNFLSNQGNWQSQLEPYLKDANLVDGFNYTFGGGLLGQNADASATQLGYFDGPGGRAVVYADGHVVWQPQP
jgi:hypothetical protein